MDSIRVNGRLQLPGNFSGLPFRTINLQRNLPDNGLILAIGLAPEGTGSGVADIFLDIESAEKLATAITALLS